ncbi:MAG: hypothetical protein WDO17_09805 [Alphaproteobacteria bacterium]
MANGEDFTRVKEVLEHLREGKPIGRDKFGLIKGIAPQAMQEFSRRVIADTIAGPQAKTFATWLVAHYGGGKTQALQELKGILSENRYGRFKVFAPVIDLNYEASRSARGLHLALFENASSLAPTPPAANVFDAEDELLNMGREFLEDAIGEVPGGGLALKWVVGFGKRQLYWWTDALRRSVERKYKFSDPGAVELMTRWMRYALFPDSETARQEFVRYQQELAEKGTLFLTLTHILKEADYASMVILIDQAEKLVNQPTLTDALMTMYAPGGSAGLNLFFVFAGTGDITGLEDLGIHGGFYRRFRDPLQSSVISVDLAQPVINQGEGNDIDRIKNVLEQLKRTYIGLPIPDLSSRRTDEIRERLIQLELKLKEEKKKLSWPMVWREMLRE